MIYTAVLIACLALPEDAAPAPEFDCVTHEMIIHGNGIPYSVAIEAQTLAAKWLADHPGYVQSGLSVRPGRSA